MPKQNHSRFILPILIFSGLYLNMVSCENTQHKTIPENKDLSFNINHKLLNNTPLKNDDGFLIYSPVEWVSFDSANFTQLKRAIEANENVIQLELVGGYQSKDFATCIISKVITIKNSFEYIPENYKDILKSQFSTENINVSQIDINNTLVRQFIISNNNHTVIKLFISGVQNYQVDYIIPRGVYEAELVKVESSIGTITNKGEKR